jgi:hypothetical protein
MVERGAWTIMLITNFSAGELSENLFGRIDIPQYYQGVSRLENFDVIPTGGIIKRNGTRRLLQMDEEGRIIPFILDRENHFLLFLTPGKIRVYLNGVLQNTAVSTNKVPLYATLQEINEVQYVQVYNNMVMVQQNYKPIQAIKSLNNIIIKVLDISFKIEVVTSAIEKSDMVELDESYIKNNYLINDYPGAITMFNGRLILGGTKNYPQRIYASKVNELNNFSTYKLFITETRNYISVQGTLNVSNNTILLDQPQDIGKFTRPLQEYFLQSTYYQENTKILGISQNGTITITNSPTGIDVDQSQWDQIVNTFNYWKDSKAGLPEWKTGPDYWYDTPSFLSTDRVLVYGYKAAKKEFIYVNDIGFTAGNGPKYKITDFYGLTDDNLDIGVPAITELTKEEIETSIKDKAYLYNLIKDKVIAGANTLSDIMLTYITFIEQKYSNFIDLLYDSLINNCQYELVVNGNSYTYYGNLQQIQEQIYGNVIYSTVHALLSFYTKEYIEDRYPTPEDGFTFEIASDMSDSIRWIGQNKNLLIGTETAEWIVPAGTTALNVQAILNSRYGSDKVQGTSIGDAMCFFQSGRKAIIEYYIPQQDNNFRANNMAMFSKNMLHESPAFDFDFISAPYTKIFVSREDGIIASLLYERSTGTFAWGRITTDGEIRSVATLPGQSGFDDVYLIVRRGTAFYLELLQEREKVYLDSYERWNDETTTGYNKNAVIYDETTNTIYPGRVPSIPGHIMWIGYPFTALVRSMPVLANDKMKQNIIKSLSIRFYNSYLPHIKSIPNNVENTISREEPYTGIVQVPFPGIYDRDVLFELIHDKPTRCQILAVNAEANY